MALMESEYLDLMVQRVVACQQHQHAVWNEGLSFDERISNLPLYALELNNCDRDPKKHGLTIAHYAPAKQEMIALTRIFESSGSKLRILDVGCGNGFIGSLLAREGLPVIGIDDFSWSPPQIPYLFDERVYEHRAPVSLEKFEDDFNVAFCSWMVPNVNLTPLIVSKRPEFIVHVYSPWFVKLQRLAVRRHIIAQKVIASLELGKH
jgi:SAM-dependent methyltransferase